MPPAKPPKKGNRRASALGDQRVPAPEGINELERFKALLEESRGQLEKALATSREKDAQLSRAAAELTATLQKNQELTSALEAATSARPAIRVDELIGQLRTAVETLNGSARKSGQQGGGESLLVDCFEVEVKAGVDLKDGLRLTQLQGREISAESVSTIRFALRPVPRLTIVEDSIEPK